ncbi:hypothetical protein AB0A69_06635 [Streptomyces sp. NPDC045431]|uniref:hypothetical protein n=1 Tax=Streptomyces sp. NPDC045431 TaxID=3155613 RepID=UPI0033DB3977
MRRIRAAASVGVAAVALTATAGCGTQAARDTAKVVEQADTIAAALARATDRTQKLGSAEVVFKTDPGTGPITMTGTYSWGKGAAYDVMMDTAAANMQEVQDDPQLRALLVDGAYYYNVDPQPSSPLQGKHWMRIDVAAVLGEEGARSVEKNADPTAGLRYIGLSKDTEDLGEQTIRGKKTQHYRATIDVKDMADKGVFSPEEEKSLLNSATGPVDTITVELWVDDADLPVRLVQEVGNLKVEADFLKFGATKAVTAPPASDTADLSDEVRENQPQG